MPDPGEGHNGESTHLASVPDFIQYSPFEHLSVSQSHACVAAVRPPWGQSAENAMTTDADNITARIIS